MIDWISCVIPYRGGPVSEKFLKVYEHAPHDPVEAFRKKVALEGSFSSKLMVQASTAEMYISCNPGRWLTGQNAVGTDDIHFLLSILFRRVCQRLGRSECPVGLAAIANGDVRLTRADCTFHYHVGTDLDVATWCEGMGQNCHARFRGRGHFDAGMCSTIFGVSMKEGAKPKGSRHSSFKFYNKWREIGQHPFTCDKAIADELRAMVEGEVRAEALYRALELKKLGLEYTRNWDENTSWMLHKSWIDKMEISQNVQLLSSQERDLRSGLKPTYRLWATGQNVRELLPRRTFYAHRKELLALHGIDIAVTRPDREKSVRAVPILEVIRAKPVCEVQRTKLFYDLLSDAA